MISVDLTTDEIRANLRVSNAIRLAELVSIAAHIDPGLIRIMRFSFLPDVEVGTEADLWFSPLIQSYSSETLVLTLEALDELRARLCTAGHPVGLQAAYQTLVQAHANFPATVQMEEELIYRGLFPSPENRVRIDDRLKSVATAMKQGEASGLVLARWVARALPRLPQAVQMRPVMREVTLGAGALLGGRVVLEGSHTPEEAWRILAGVLPPDLSGGIIPIRLLREGLELDAKDTEGTKPLQLPLTNPMLLEVKWKEGQQDRIELAHWTPGETGFFPTTATEMRLRTVLGEVYFLRKELSTRKPGAIINIDLVIESVGNQERVRLFDGATEIASIEFHSPFSIDEMLNWQSQFEKQIEYFGDKLFRSIFSNKLYDLWLTRKKETQQSETQLRLRLHLNDIDNIFPWESLYDSQNRQFLALDRQVSIVRYLPTLEAHPTVTVQMPLRVLVVIASPSDQESINIDQVVKDFQKALATLQDRRLVQLEILAHASLELLQQHLSREEYHILHFIGHAGGVTHLGKDMSETRADEVLHFEDPQRSSFRVSGPQFASIIAESKYLRLILLHISSNDKSNTAVPNAALGQTLVNNGISTVVSIEADIQDQAVWQFTQEFYSGISAGQSIDEALSRTRRTLSKSNQGIAWVTPVLVTSSPDLRPFDLRPPIKPGWCPWATAKPITPKNFASGREKQTIRAVVLHVAAGPGRAIFPTFNDPDRATSAHFAVFKDGTVEQYVSLLDTALAVGLRWESQPMRKGARSKKASAGHWINSRNLEVKPTWDGMLPGISPNLYTVSIEHEGQPIDDWTPQMHEANTRLLKWIAEQTGLKYIPHQTLIGHNEIDPVDKANCPGPKVDYVRIAADANPVQASVFISHSQKDVEFAHRLQQALEKVEIQVWMAEHDVRPEENIASKINQDLEDTRVFLLILSPDSLASAWVKEELNAALQQSKPVLPILYRPVTGDIGLPLLNYSLNDFTKPDYFENAFQFLLTKIRAILGRTPIEQSVVEAVLRIKWMSIDSNSLLVKYAQANQLGYPQTEEFIFKALGNQYVGQVFNMGIVYIEKAKPENIFWFKKPGEGRPSSDPIQAAALQNAQTLSWMPINTYGALYKFAMANQLGYPQTDEFEFQAQHTSYVGQVYEHGIVYVGKGDWVNPHWVSKPAERQADNTSQTRPQEMIIPPFIFGIHDADGRDVILKAGKVGWIVVSAQVKDQNTDFSKLAELGFGVIVRLNYGYSIDGTIPNSKEYDHFAEDCARFVARSRGAHIWIIGNETNSAWERPGNQSGTGGETITPTLYAQCFAQCRSAIQREAQHANDWVIPAPPALYNNQTSYSGNPSGDWVQYFKDILNECLRIGASPDALALHAITHGPSADLLTSEGKMSPPFQSRREQFRAYRDFLDAVPKSLRNIPVLITEAQPEQWENRNTGWIQAAYREINDWNSDASHQPIQALCLFRWHTGSPSWSISDKPELIADFESALKNDYRVRWASPDTKGSPIEA